MGETNLITWYRFAQSEAASSANSRRIQASELKGVWSVWIVSAGVRSVR